VRGLYDTVPFLLALALSVLAASLGVVLARVLRRRDTRFQKFVLVREGKLQASGATFTAFGALGVALVLHSGWIRWHEFSAERALAEIERSGASASDPRVLAASEHVALVRKFGLIDSRAAKLRQARVAELEGRYEDAERVLAALSGGEPKDRLVVLPLARVWAMQGKTAEAERWLEAALALVPEVQHDRRDALDFLGEVHLRRGELAVRAGDLALARERLEKALEFTPKWSLVHYQLGVVHGSLGEVAQAKACFARAVELAPGDVDARNNLGFMLLDEGLTVDAERQLRTAVGLAPTHAAAQFNLGRALLALGRENEAREHLAAARQLDPRFDEAVGQVLGTPR
jgi:Flp pilus assembly protein TadD